MNVLRKSLRDMALQDRHADWHAGCDGLPASVDWLCK